MIKKIVKLFILMMMMTSGIVTSFATHQIGSLTIQTEFSDMTFYLYKVAALTNDGYQLCGEFENYPILLDLDTTESQLALASTLETYVVVDGIKETFSKTTGNDVDVIFHPLEKGLYLVLCEPVIVEDVQYHFSPYVMAVPNSVKGEVVYDVVSEPKSSVVEEKLYDHISVLKIWDGDINVDSITIQLFKDGEFYEEQILSSENGWSYTSETLPYGHDWKVVEVNVPNNYTVTYQQKETHFIIENTYEEPKDPVDPDDEKIPQTGQLWWPVPVLGAVGIISIAYGWYKKDEE